MVPAGRAAGGGRGPTSMQQPATGLASTPHGADAAAEVPWCVDCPGYAPVEVNRFDLLEQWSDEPRDAAAVVGLSKRVSYEGPFTTNPTTGRPLNPRGRTGVSGRGLIDKWGPNQAEDPIVTSGYFRRREGKQISLSSSLRTGYSHFAPPGPFSRP